MKKEEIKEYVSFALKDPNVNLLSYLAADINETIAFIKESTDSEFNILADYFEDIAFMSQSHEFVDAIKERFIKIKDTSLDLKFICTMIQYAEEVFPQEEF